MRFLLLVALAMATSAAMVPPLGFVEPKIDLVKEVESIEVYAGSSDSSTTTEEITSTSDTGSTSEENTESTESSLSSEYSENPATDSSTTETSDQDSGDNGLSGGAIAGIVIGSLAGVGLIVGGIVFLKVKKLLCFG